MTVSPITACNRWNLKCTGANSRAILDVSLPNMIAQEGVKFAQLDDLKNKVKAAHNYLGLLPSQLIAALDVCREAWKLQNTHTGPTLINEIQNRRNTIWLVKYPLIAADCINLMFGVFNITIV
jgi:hypothetical protein